MKLSIQPYDARCPFDQSVSLIDLDNANRLISCHRRLIDATKAKALLLYEAGKLFADPELKRIAIGSKEDALPRGLT